MFFLSDEYEQVSSNAYWTDEQSTRDWKATISLYNVDEEIPEIGIRLEYLRDLEQFNIDDIEFFVNTDVGGFFFQDLEMENFDGEIYYTQPCEICANTEGYYLYTNISINWRQNAQKYNDYIDMDVYLEESNTN